MGRLSQNFRVPGAGGRVTATVLAEAARDRGRSDPEYLPNLRAERWEVVIPEIIVEPEGD